MKDVLINSKICLGPMSKNIVDTIIHYSNNNKKEITLIPSRRQIEYNGGYVNNWTTEEFSKYVKSKSKLIAIQRDHGGPGQGLNKDDGYESLRYDSKYLDSIHIDPWKEYKEMEESIKWTINMINFCYNINNNLYFEVGTEEAIRKISESELEYFIESLKKNCKYFDRILFCVIQSGTSLENGLQTGLYNSEKLSNMIEILEKYKLLSKEHNGDYMKKDIMKERFDKGLTSINIAPELGLFETQIILELIDDNLFELFYKICLKSGKWKKWVSNDFNPEENKKKLIEICGHYVFSYEEFKIIYDSLNHSYIKERIYKKIEEYYL